MEIISVTDNPQGNTVSEVRASTMEIYQHHKNKMLAAYRHNFAVAGQVASSRTSLNELCAAGYMEMRPYQPDKRSKPTERFYLTEKGREFIEPIARRQAEHQAKMDAEIQAKEWLQAAAPDMLTELKRLYELHGHQSTADVIAKATGTTDTHRDSVNEQRAGVVSK